MLMHAKTGFLTYSGSMKCRRCNIDFLDNQRSYLFMYRALFKQRIYTLFSCRLVWGSTTLFNQLPWAGCTWFTERRKIGREARKVKTGVTKRCRLPWRPNSALVYETNCGRGGVAGSQPMRKAVHRSPNELWRSNSLFTLWWKGGAGGGLGWGIGATTSHK
jgi:hypothetical protein